MQRQVHHDQTAFASKLCDLACTSLLPLEPKNVSMLRAAPRVSGGTRLAGRALILARAACLGWIALVVLLVAMALPVRHAELVSMLQNLTPAQEAVLQELGLTGVLHPGQRLALELVVIFVFVGTGLLIVAQRPRDWVALHVSAALTAYIAWVAPPLDALVSSHSVWEIPATAVQAVGLMSALLFFYIFPDGRFVPSWTRFLLVVSAAFALAWVLLPGSVFDLTNPFQLGVPSFVVVMLAFTSCIAVQVYRFTEVAGPAQRQQTKWILYATATAIGAYMLFGVDRFALPALREARVAGFVYDMFGVPLFLTVLIVVPVAFAISILRHRLWDIDVIISRTFVYGSLMAIVSGISVASITFSQRLFVALTGQVSDTAVVLTTLVAAALIAPLKNGLERVTKRWMGPRPDPAQVLQVFGDQVRTFVETVDVQQLTAKALDTAIRAFGASSGAVYLRINHRFQLVHERGEWAQIEGISAWLDGTAGHRYGWIVLGRLTTAGITRPETKRCSPRWRASWRRRLE
jgi:hypothetical protein